MTAAASTPPLRPASAIISWRLAISVVALVGFALPFALTGFLTFQVTLALTYAIAILGLNLLTGFNGQVSLGHGAFVATGAYVAGVLAVHAGLPFVLAALGAVVVAGCAGAAFGLLARRLGTHELGVATFAVALAAPQIPKSSLVEDWTGGASGMVVPRLKPPAGVPLSRDQWAFLVVAVAALCSLAAVRFILASRFGRDIVAVRDNAVAAAASGVPVDSVRRNVFALSAMTAGLSGALTAGVTGFIAPDAFTATLSISLFVGLIVSGLGSTAACIFGGFFVVFVPNIAEGISKGLSWAVYGVVVGLVILAAPGGVAGVLRRLMHSGKSNRGDSSRSDDAAGTRAR